MKNNEKDKARELYFQANMSKTEIANQLGLPRRTVLLWCRQQEWDKLRRSASTMPTILAEKIYYLLDNYLTQLLRSPDMFMVNHKDAQTIYLLTSAIKKLKKKSTVNETMEMFNSFLENLKKRKPELAAEVRPEMEEYVATQADAKTSDNYLEGIDQFGGMGYPTDEEEDEKFRDEQDLAALEEEIKRTPDYEQALKNWQQQPAASIPANPIKNPPPPETNTNSNTTT